MEFAYVLHMLEEKEMTTDKEVLEKLSAPFHPSRIKTRKQGGRELHYIDARTVMNRLDSVLGPGGWRNTFEFHGERTLCFLTVNLPETGWITKVDGAGDTNIEGEKGGISDALKRAAVLFGIGRYLYSGEDPTAVYKRYLEKKDKATTDS